MNIWTNGCFDIIHAGHIELFKFAKSLGDKLIVGIDADTRVRELKGKNRPINTLKYRLIVLESIKYIDKIVVFDSDISLCKHVIDNYINIMVVGSDHKNHNIVGKNEHTKIVFFDRVFDLSTSSLCQKS
jgi:rfaE bifunctional protein nucleotidyltransferase chain/domain